MRFMTADSNDHAPALLRALTVFAPLAGCAGEPTSPPASANAPVVDMVAPPPGVSDRGYDPAVVAIDFGGPSLCSGTLIASDVVLTARHCVTVDGAPVHCPASGRHVAPVLMPMDSLRVLVGDDMSTASERARARAVLLPPDASLCGSDVAIVLLDQAIDDVKPLAVRPTGAAKGDHVRTVGFGPGMPHAMKMLRDHVAVTSTTTTELQLAEAMTGGGGGPALDETSSEVLGVVSRGDDEPEVDVYTRADAFLSLVESALAASLSSGVSDRSASKPTKGPVDMGANCTQGADCAAGVCVLDGMRQYCSRTCAADDRCPAKFRCERSSEGQQICVAD
jgi:hypothetical protein